jgi:hypothetical protein
MAKTRPQIFRENRPTISDDDAVAAAKADRTIVSFNAQPVFITGMAIVAIAIKFKLGNGSTETLLIDRYPATILKMLFDRLQENDWTGTILVPDDATPH